MMENDANRLIDDMFGRLEKAERQSGERDQAAESRIREHVTNQPAAPYYMAQTIIMQEATLKRLKARVDELEKNQSQSAPASGGFLAGLFGGGSDNSAQAAQRPASNRGARQSGPSSAPGWGAQGTQPGGMGSHMGRGGGSGFLSGALQTAAGVAGGVMLGNLMMDMFDQDHPEEIVESIDDTPDAADSGAGDGGMAPADMDTSDMNDPGQDGGLQDTGFDDGDMGGGFDDFGDGFDEL
ncbi:DUF2076 domain-containing protein [Larsenimonas salina]|uniref:DUF2076 domain-containing protein n=1 Tax=Larsenimonas salina TaxID=1295565 RepID=UPI0020730FC9|nr:DUF2076 domain-containing protein [Larsenimonas salina]MCM5704186.1 DUF2076 domain-containing protein [Larsenimonas salina]